MEVDEKMDKQRWEYLYETIKLVDPEYSEDLEDLLEQRGNEAWELTSTHLVFPNSVICFFKRPLDKNESPERASMQMDAAFGRD